MVDSTASSKLFMPLKIGPITLSHRVVMAPMTRLRSSDSHVPLDMVKTYYSQRASVLGTLLITEATFISAKSRGRDANAPGMFFPEQVAQWRTIVDAVHARGCFIFCQLWHVGRAARKHELERLGLECVSSSAIRMPAPKNLSRPDEAYVTPRAMIESEMYDTISDFATAAGRAVHEAGFDGVEIHAANGYLIDQFNQSSCNVRTDDWGGSVANRARFCLEVVSAVCRAIGPERTAVRLSPFSPFQGMGTTGDPRPQFAYIIEQLSKMKLAYLHLIESRVSGNTDREQDQKESLDFALKAWNQAGPVILAGGFSPQSARVTVEDTYPHEDVAIAFGRHFISNPDLPQRIMNGSALATYDRDTFYKAKSADGYTDYGFATASSL